MDFFTHQEHARRQTGKLVVLFALAVIAIIVAIYAVAVAIVGLTDSPGVGGWWDPRVFAFVAIGVLLVVAGGSLYKTAQLRAGGSVVARQLGGRIVQPNTTDPDERKLFNVVEEMSISSGTPMPSVYVLDGEEGINAFAAGLTPSDAAIGVTRGCIAELNRDELQGVIAHEFSHVFNGDMRLNIKLIGVLHGILCIALTGYMILRSARYSGRGSRNNGGAILVIALALVVTGYVGLFCARLIQAAVSRQREFLADASAVQFTRNPSGIAGALKKIGGFLAGSRIRSGQAEATSHMFFGNALRSAWLGALATHPPLRERIRRIEGTAPKVVEPTPTAAAATAAAAGFAGSSAQGFFAATGNPTERHLARGRAILAELPLALNLALHEPFSARAVVFALLLDRDPTMRGAQMRRLEALVGAATARETEQLVPAAHALAATSRLAVVDLALPALREMSPQQFTLFGRAVQSLIAADERIDLFELVLHRVLLRHLATSYGTRRAPRARVKSLAPIAMECRIVLSRLALVGHANDAAARAGFAAGAAAIDALSTDDLLPDADCRFEHVDRALDRIAEATPTVKRTFLSACADTVAVDGVVAPAEADLLRAIADGLDCPVPPVID